jgi:DNA-binding CsgD family transcriptional regulator
LLGLIAYTMSLIESTSSLESPANRRQWNPQGDIGASDLRRMTSASLARCAGPADIVEEDAACSPARDPQGGGGRPRADLAARDRAVPRDPPDGARITPHETRLLKLFVDGHNYNTAAAELRVSANTLNFHVRSIYEKLQIHSRSEAVVKVLINRLV